MVYLCPGLVSDTFLLDKVALDSFSSIAVREFPDQPHGRPGDVSHPQLLWRSGDVCTPKELQSVIQEQRNNDPSIPTQKNRLRFEVEQLRDVCRVRVRHTKDIDSDVDVFLSGLVLGGDGVASRVGPQTDGDNHGGLGVGRLNLNTQNP